MIANINQPLLSDAILIKNEFLNYKTTFSENNKQYKYIVKELVDMGFELEMIDMCFCFFNVVSIEQAISFLTKEDGVWQHQKIESENNLCIICNENSYHLNDKISSNNPKQIERESLNQRLIHHSKNSRSSNSNLFNKQESEVFIKFKGNLEINNNYLYINPDEEKIIEKTESNKFILCKVCEIESPSEETYHLSCEHYFCKDCWYYYLDQKISHSEVLQINCMMKGCTEILTDENIKKIVGNNPELFEKYKKFRTNKIVMNDKNKKFCPEVNCSGYLEKTSKENFICCQNGHQFCYNCLKRWHKKKNCEEVDDEDFEKWRKGKYIKQCPNCQFWTEKNEGCNHMTCKACNHNWCWYCSGAYTANHYTRLGNCYGLQFGKNNFL